MVQGSPLLEARLLAVLATVMCLFFDKAIGGPLFSPRSLVGPFRPWLLVQIGAGLLALVMGTRRPGRLVRGLEMSGLVTSSSLALAFFAFILYQASWVFYNPGGSTHEPAALELLARLLGLAFVVVALPGPPAFVAWVLGSCIRTRHMPVREVLWVPLTILLVPAALLLPLNRMADEAVDELLRNQETPSTMTRLRIAHALQTGAFDRIVRQRDPRPRVAEVYEQITRIPLRSSQRMMDD